MKKLHLLMLCLAALAFCRCDDKRVTVGDLTVEMLENPVGLDERTPRFGWQRSARRSAGFLPDRRGR